MRVSTTDGRVFSRLDQLVNQVSSSDQKWFSLLDNTLDGTFKLLPHNLIWGVNSEIGSFTSFGNGAKLSTIVHPISGKTVKAISLPVGANVPVASTATLSLKASTDYVVIFDIWATDNQAGSINVDLFPDTLPQRLVSVTTAVQTYVWELNSSNADMSSCTLRFFNDVTTPNPSTIYITNIFMFEKETSEVGWWGTRLSDSLGNFSTVSQATIDFEKTISVPGLIMTGDAITGDYPVDFAIDLYNDSTLVYSESVTGNTEVIWRKFLSTTYNVTKIQITISKVSRGNRPVRIQEAGYTFAFLRTDSLSTVVNDRIIRRFTSTDSLVIREQIETTYFEVNVNSSDEIVPTTQEDIVMNNVHTAMDRDARQIFAKVEVTYSDPFTDQSIQISSNSLNRISNIIQTADGVSNTQHKWFSLFDNKLDGSFYPVDKASEVGWWSNSLSESDGSFLTPPSLTVTFNPRGLQSLRVVGDNVSNIFPVDFTVEIYDMYDTLVYTKSVINNSVVTWQEPLSPTLDNCTKAILTIEKINAPNHVARILEFFTSLVEVYEDNSGLMWISLLEEREVTNGSLPIGNISSNEVDIRFDNSSKLFDPENPFAPLSKYLTPNRKVRIWFGVEIYPGYIEWHPRGVFWTTNWKISTQELYAQLTARDRLNLLDSTVYSAGVVKENVSLGELARDVLIDYGLTSSEYYIDPYFETIIVPIGWIDRVTHREALRQIALAGLGVVYADVNGVVRLESGTPRQYSYYTFHEDRNIFDKQRPMKWDKVVNSVEVTWNPLALQTSQPIYLAQNLNILLDPGESMVLELEALLKPVYIIDNIILTGGTDIVVADRQDYAWGCVATITNQGTSSQNLTSITVNGQTYRKYSTVERVEDAALIKDLGKLSYRLDSDLVQTRSLASQIATTLLNSYKDPQRNFSLSTRGNIALTLGDRVSVLTSTGLIDCTLTKQEFTYDGSLSGKVETAIIP